MVRWLVLVQERRLSIKPAADAAIHGQPVSLPARLDALGGVLDGCAAGDLGVQMRWISPAFRGQDLHSDVTYVTLRRRTRERNLERLI